MTIVGRLKRWCEKKYDSYDATIESCSLILREDHNALTT